MFPLHLRLRGSGSDHSQGSEALNNWLLLSICLSLLLQASPCACAESLSPGASENSKVRSEDNSVAKTPLLTGGVKHAEELPSLEDSLRPGQVFSDDLLLKASTETNDRWYRVPSWYAGVRHADDCIIVYRYDYETEQASAPMQKQLDRQDMLTGFQKDKNGGIWDFKHLPTIQHVESDQVNAVLYVKTITPLEGSEQHLVIKYEEISITLSKATNKILSVVQQEQINTITCPQPGILRLDISVKSFGWDGVPQRLEQSVMMVKVTKPFEQIDQYQGRDLRASFRDYLIAQHLESLVPDNLPNNSAIYSALVRWSGLRPFPALAGFWGAGGGILVKSVPGLVGGADKSRPRPSQLLFRTGD